MKTIYRYSVPVDDKPHTFELSSDPVRVEAIYTGLGEYEVEFWAEFHTQWPVETRVFKIYGTGHQIPSAAEYWGTCQRINGMVWHLYEI